ncbi:MAG: alpha/beta hydrolase, partial [Candidatus Goldiibacteriota bacterium]
GNPKGKPLIFLHGGPGAAGELKNVAARAAQYCGVIEALQGAVSISGQVEELKAVVERNAPEGAVLAGHSWGAWLAWIFAAQFPKLVKKIILISSPPFKAEYAEKIMQTRLSRLNSPMGQELQFLLSNIENKAVRDRRRLMERLEQIMSKSDTCSPDMALYSKPEHNPDIYVKVWNEAAEMRKSGELLLLSRKIKCHVTAIHGDYDPSPAEGVKIPLSAVKRKFTFHLLKNCGHSPWLEKDAAENFFSILKEEILK